MNTNEIEWFVLPNFVQSNLLNWPLASLLDTIIESKVFKDLIHVQISFEDIFPPKFLTFNTIQI